MQNLARTMGNSGRQRVEKLFDIEGVLGKIEALYAIGLSKK
jgi:hypothetical protein